MSNGYSEEQEKMIAIYIGVYLNTHASAKALEEGKALYNDNPSISERELVKKSADLLMTSINMLKSVVPSSIIARVPAGRTIKDLEALAIDALLKLKPKL